MIFRASGRLAPCSLPSQLLSLSGVLLKRCRNPAWPAPGKAKPGCVQAGSDSAQNVLAVGDRTVLS